MRLVSTLLFLALTGTIAGADGASPTENANAAQPVAVVAKAKVPLRVVRILEETQQALLFDKVKGTHVLAEVGSSIDGFTVQDIDDDEVTLVGENGTQVVLAAPDWRRHRADDAPTGARPATPAVKPAAAPAAVAADAAMAPIDPYAEPDAPIRTVDAQVPPHAIDAGDGGVRVAEAPGPTPAPPVAAPPAAAPPVATTSAPAATPVVTTALAVPAPAPAIDPDAPLVLPRADVAAALSNFGKLAGSVRGTFTPTGVKLESIVAGSLFAKIGLRAGDLIASVDNHPLHSIDDAAELYARASSARNVSIQLTRAGKPITLHVLIQ